MHAASVTSLTAVRNGMHLKLAYEILIVLPGVCLEGEEQIYS